GQRGGDRTEERDDRRGYAGEAVGQGQGHSVTSLGVTVLGVTVLGVAGLASLTILAEVARSGFFAVKRL
ncbi:MAG TPA: hypothetical protein VGE73_02535, partial [Pseudolabrys sp.]